MIFFIVFDTKSVTIFNNENKTKPGFYKSELGRIITDLNPLHLSSEVNTICKKLKSFGVSVHNIQDAKEQISFALRTKEHIALEYYF